MVDETQLFAQIKKNKNTKKHLFNLNVSHAVVAYKTTKNEIFMYSEKYSFYVVKRNIFEDMSYIFSV